MKTLYICFWFLHIIIHITVYNMNMHLFIWFICNYAKAINQLLYSIVFLHELAQFVIDGQGSTRSCFPSSWIFWGTAIGFPWSLKCSSFPCPAAWQDWINAKPAPSRTQAFQDMVQLIKEYQWTQRFNWRNIWPVLLAMRWQWQHI